MGEFELIRQFFLRGAMGTGVRVGIGDDCAVLRVPRGMELVVSVDTQVAGRHFPADAEPRDIGRRALCCALSDLAAMGAVPVWFTLALTLPEAQPAWLCGFSDGLFSIAEQYDIALVGGDTTRGPLTITIAVHGYVPAGRALLRSGAAPGDIVCVTGYLGDGAAALALLEREITASAETGAYLLKRYYAPTPRLREGQWLREVASAAVDISDGLLADLGHLCDASGVGARVDAGRLPLHDSWRQSVGDGVARQWALAGGDDYELCFTVPRPRLGRLAYLMRERDLMATPIGEVVRTPGVVPFLRGSRYPVAEQGFEHFG